MIFLIIAVGFLIAGCMAWVTGAPITVQLMCFVVAFLIAVVDGFGGEPKG